MNTIFKLGLVLDLALALSVACGGSLTSSSTVSAIAISPSPCAVGRTDSVQMSALATLSDGTKQDMTTKVAWRTGSANTATVNASGVVVGVNAGITGITAEYDGASGSVDCAVGF